MELRPNRIRRKLAAGEATFVAGGFTHPDDIDAFGPAGFDGVWLEGEHGGVDAADLGNLTRACDIWGMTSVVRVNRNDQGLIYRPWTVVLRRSSCPTWTRRKKPGTSWKVVSTRHLASVDSIPAVRAMA